MNYKDLLKNAADGTGNCACMGLDPQPEALPNKTGNIKNDIILFFEELFFEMKKRNLYPAAFKPNLGYYSALDKPRENRFEGSQALASILAVIEKEFAGIPVILDSKRGDIARSSLNYAAEAFDWWKTDAVTVSPFMGSDSVLPFLEKPYDKKGVYILNRTSNPGSADFQNLRLEEGGAFLYMHTAKKIIAYAHEHPGAGAVVGATVMEELTAISELYAKKGIPLLIPGAGSQGGSAEAVTGILKKAGYDLRFARINSSSALTHPWKKAPPPQNYADICIGNIEKFLQETKTA